VNALEGVDSESERDLLYGSWEPVAILGGWLQVPARRYQRRVGAPSRLADL